MAEGVNLTSRHVYGTRSRNEVRHDGRRDIGTCEGTMRASRTTAGLPPRRTALLAVADAKGKAVQGEMAPDGKSWVPAEALKWGTRYTATITVDGADGETATT